MIKQLCFFNFTFYFIILPFLLDIHDSFAQVVINEVSSANYSAIPDEDGDFEDWIEFYNAGTNSVNLLNYNISRTEDKIKNWKFPELTIKPQSFLVVFASGKSRKLPIDHWETVINAHDLWRYLAGTVEPDSLWRETAYDDSGWQQGPGGFGFGDGDDSTVVAPVVSLFIRTNFQIADTSKVMLAILSVDYDDGFVAYFNGIEVARANIGTKGVPPPFGLLASENHEANIYRGGTPEKFLIGKEALAAALVPGINVLAIEVHNADTVSSGDMSAITEFHIALNDTSITYPLFPSALSGLHADFKLSSSGQTLALSDSSGNIIDVCAIGAMRPDNSRGRNPDGDSSWCLFGIPSPGASDNFSFCASSYADTPVFSLNAGFYSGNQILTISSSQSIHYTTDGNIPSDTSPVYSSPIIIDSTQVVRARCFNEPFMLPGETVTNTYIIDDAISLPVISLSINPGNLWDWNSGMYVMGPDASPVIPFMGANFWKDWERIGHAEYFDKTGSQGFELDAGLKIFGNYTRAFPQKGFRVIARDNYGTSQINYPLFSGRNFITYKNFLIRNAGNDWNIVHFRDGLLHKAVKQTHLDIMEREPSVVFLNGQYWGVYELRERQDKYYLANNYGVDENNVDLLEYNGSILEGNNGDFLNMSAFIASNSMQDSSNFDSVKTMFDIENFCDYFIVETYANNNDWVISNDPGAKPGEVNNVKFWRTANPPGKWRYILWDMDVTMGLYGLTNDNSLAATIDASNPHSIMLKQLLQNTSFRNYFINRYADLLNTVFFPANINALAYSLRDEIAPEMARHFQKWGNTFPNTIGAGTSHDIPSWNNAIGILTFFLNYRPGYMRNFIRSQFSLNKNVNITLAVSPPGAGTIKISTVIPDSLPWTGVYFDGNPVTVTAAANQGFHFLYWKSPVLIPTPDTDSSFTLNVTQDESFTAYFDTVAFVDTLAETGKFGFNVYPNPLSDEITIYYRLPADARISVNIFSAAGKDIFDIIPGGLYEKAGVHKLQINSGTLPEAGGVFFIKFTYGNNCSVKRIVLTGISKN